MTELYIHDADEVDMVEQLEYDKLMEHLGVVEDERNALLKEKELVYEAIVGDDGVNRFTHDEIIERIYDLYDTYVKHLEEDV